MNWENYITFQLLSKSKFNDVYTLLFSVQLESSHFPNATVYENIHIHINDFYEQANSYSMYLSGEVYDVSSHTVKRKRMPLSAIVHSKEQEQAFLSTLEEALFENNIVTHDYISQES